MISQPEVRLSLEMIDRAMQRLRFQEAVVAKLNFGQNDRCAYLAKEMQDVLQRKIIYLQEKHAALIREKNPSHAHDQFSLPEEPATFLNGFKR